MQKVIIFIVGLLIGAGATLVGVRYFDATDEAARLATLRKTDPDAYLREIKGSRNKFEYMKELRAIDPEQYLREVRADLGEAYYLKELEKLFPARFQEIEAEKERQEKARQAERKAKEEAEESRLAALRKSSPRKYLEEIKKKDGKLYRKELRSLLPEEYKKLIEEEQRREVLRRSKWTLQEETSKIDDSKNVFVSVRANESITDKYGRRIRTPTLTLRCMEKRTALIVDWNVYLGIGTTRMLYRIDKKKHVRSSWEISTDYEAVGLWSSRRAIPMIKRMLGAKKILFEIVPYGDNPTIISFDITGVEYSIEPIRRVCKW